MQHYAEHATHYAEHPIAEHALHVPKNKEKAVVAIIENAMMFGVKRNNSGVKKNICFFWSFSL